VTGRPQDARSQPPHPAETSRLTDSVDSVATSVPVPVGISLAAPLERVHTFTLRGREGLDLLSVGVDVIADDPQRFEAELTTVQLGAIAVDSLAATAYRTLRTPRRIAADGLDVAYFCMVRLGRGEVEQDGRRGRHQAGSAVLLRSSSPYRSYLLPAPTSPPRSHVVLTSIPVNLLGGKAEKIAGLTAAPLPRSPLQAAANSFLTTVSLGLPQPGSATASFVEHAIVDLLLAVIAERTADSLPPESAEAGTRVRIRDFVLRRLPDAELGPARIASEFGISTRYLHRLFESEDSSVGSFIRHERLKKAARELADPTLRHLDLKAIAARSGFAGADQFGRAFKSRYGMTPREYRRVEKSDQSW
jgi:AraC-like DNA-binding protein